MMPNDENNGVVSQGQQVDPNLNGSPVNQNQNSGNSDDFDFSFDDSNTNPTADGLSGDMQDQMRRQGRTGMFLTPDETITKSNENSDDMSFGQIDLSSTVQPQKRSGMFLTPDEEATKEETQIEGKEYSFQGGQGTQGETGGVSGDEDSYLAGIDPSDVVSTEDEYVDPIQEDSSQSDSSTQDQLDGDIENLISFDNEPVNTPNTEGVSSNDADLGVESQTSDAVGAGVAPNIDENKGENTVNETENQTVSNVEVKNEGVTVQPVDVQSEVSLQTKDSSADLNGEIQNNTQEIKTQTADVASGDNVSTEDWLAQEDKNVEENFGDKNQMENVDVNSSSEEVAQNVENIINNTSVVGSENLTQDQTTVDVAGDTDNGLGNINSDEGVSGGVGDNQNYVPNEEDFSQMSDLLNSSGAGQVNLNNIDSQMLSNVGGGVDNNVQNMDTLNNQIQENLGGVNLNDVSVVNGSSVTDQNDVPVVETSTTTDLQGATAPVVDNGMTAPVVDNGMTAPVVDNGMAAPVVDEGMNTQVVDNGMTAPVVDNGMTAPVIDNGINTQVADEGINNPVDNGINNPVDNGINNGGGISLDAMIENIGTIKGVSQGDGQNGAGSLIGSVNQEMQEQTNDKTVKVKKKKKQSGFVVLGVFLGICLIVFLAIKMFPDKLSELFKFSGGLFGKENVVEVVDDNNIGVENGTQDDTPDGIEPNDVGGDDIINVDDQLNPTDVIDEIVPSEEPEPDPDSLAALLSGDTGGDENGSDQTNPGNEEDQHNSGDIVEDSDLTGTNDSSFDPFGEVGEILDEKNNLAELKERLTDYISKGEFYIDWGTRNSNAFVVRYGEYINVTAKEELGKLENGEEIDITVFGKFDELLQKLSDLTT